MRGESLAPCSALAECPPLCIRAPRSVEVIVVSMGNLTSLSYDEIPRNDVSTDSKVHTSYFGRLSLHLSSPFNNNHPHLIRTYNLRPNECLQVTVVMTSSSHAETSDFWGNDALMYA